MLRFRVARQSGKPYAIAAIGTSERSMELRSSYLAKHSRRIADTKRTRSASNAKGEQPLNPLLAT